MIFVLYPSYLSENKCDFITTTVSLLSSSLIAHLLRCRGGLLWPRGLHLLDVLLLLWLRLGVGRGRRQNGGRGCHGSGRHRRGYHRHWRVTKKRKQLIFFAHRFEIIHNRKRWQFLTAVLTSLQAQGALMYLPTAPFQVVAGGGIQVLSRIQFFCACFSQLTLWTQQTDPLIRQCIFCHCSKTMKKNQIFPWKNVWKKIGGEHTWWWWICCMACGGGAANTPVCGAPCGAAMKFWGMRISWLPAWRGPYWNLAGLPADPCPPGAPEPWPPGAACWKIFSLFLIVNY